MLSHIQITLCNKPITYMVVKRYCDKCHLASAHISPPACQACHVPFAASPTHLRRCVQAFGAVSPSNAAGTCTAKE